MDFFFHALLPYLLGRFLGLKREYLAAFVLGGIAPDLDTLVVWINQIHPTSYLIVHRGFTHTLFFGFFLAAILLFLVSRNSIKVRSRGFITEDLEFSLSALAYAYGGIISHLFLDFLTTGGVPLFYPLTATRYSAGIFSRIEIVIMIATLLVIAKLITGRQKIKIDKRMSAVFLIFLLVVSGIRIGGKEMAYGFYEDSPEIYPDLIFSSGSYWKTTQRTIAFGFPISTSFPESCLATFHISVRISRSIKADLMKRLKRQRFCLRSSSSGGDPMLWPLTPPKKMDNGLSSTTILCSKLSP